MMRHSRFVQWMPIQFSITERMTASGNLLRVLALIVKLRFKFLHGDTLNGREARVSGAGGRWLSALCNGCLL